jgi:hypothetical protein
MRTSPIAILLFAVAAFLGALGQFFYKSGADQTNGSLRSYLLNARLFAGVICYVAVMALFVTAFKKGGALTVLYPVYASTFIWAALIAWLASYILFPEGTRTRYGEMGNFKPGLGRLVAETDIPVVACYLRGTFDVLPPSGSIPRWKKITVSIAQPLSFASATNDRAGWEAITRSTEAAVRALAN